MRYPFLFLACLLFSAAIAQDSTRNSINETMTRMESLRVRTDSLMEANMRRNDSIEMARFAEQNARSLNAFMASRKEAERKAEKKMWIQLGLGVFFLVVLIYGLMRKKKRAS